MQPWYRTTCTVLCKQNFNCLVKIHRKSSWTKFMTLLNIFFMNSYEFLHPWIFIIKNSWNMCKNSQEFFKNSYELLLMNCSWTLDKFLLHSTVYAKELKLSFCMANLQRENFTIFNLRPYMQGKVFSLANYCISKKIRATCTFNRGVIKH